MNIEQLLNDAKFLYQGGKPQAALCLMLIAVSAASRKMFPRPATPSAQNIRQCKTCGQGVVCASCGNVVQKGPGKMEDPEAFTTFFDTMWPKASSLTGFCIRAGSNGGGARGMEVCLDGKWEKLSSLIYRMYRCELIHEARLHVDCEFIPQNDPRDANPYIEVSGKILTISYGLLNTLDIMVRLADPKTFPILVKKAKLKLGQDEKLMLDQLVSECPRPRDHKAHDHLEMFKEFIAEFSDEITKGSVPQIQRAFTKWLEQNGRASGAASRAAYSGLVTQRIPYNSDWYFKLSMEQRMEFEKRLARTQTLTSRGVAMAKSLCPMYDIVLEQV